MEERDIELQMILEYLTKTAMDKLGISREAAQLRITAIHKSGILRQFGSPDKEPFQIAIDAAMRIPQIGIEQPKHTT